MDKTIIRVIVEGGVVQDISNIPRDIVVEIRDYDTDQLPDPDDPSNYSKEDENGDIYWCTEWDSGNFGLT